MKDKELQNEQLFIIDGQLIGSILYIVSILISIIIILDQRKKALGKKEFLTSQESQILALGNKIFILLLIIWFLYLNYKSYELAKNTNQDTSALQIQIAASILSLIVGLMTLYVVATNFQNTNFQTAEIENSFI
ncbi:MAG: hypothetical protein E7168_01880 [Firmicutes bacterium]|nr:hypothetical protein [Bacillota bacterium]